MNEKFSVAHNLPDVLPQQIQNCCVNSCDGFKCESGSVHEVRESVLNLTLKKKWFEMIASGEKLEEYREIKKSWIRRLLIDVETKNPRADYPYLIERLTSGQLDGIGFSFRPFDTFHFFNGWCFSQSFPNIRIQALRISIGKPNPIWCNPEDANKTVFILHLGSIKPKI